MGASLDVRGGYEPASASWRSACLAGAHPVMTMVLARLGRASAFDALQQAFWRRARRGAVLIAAG